MSADPTKTCRAAGFTLVELLIVISILGVLAAVLVPALIGGDESAKRTATEARMQQLETACGTFEREYGIYPSDDLSPPPGEKADWKKDNERNTGIESLVCMVSRGKQKGGSSLLGFADNIVNTDGDTHGAPLPMLDGRTDRVEIADDWGTPLVYFNARSFDKKQTVVPGVDLAPVLVAAKKRPDGSYYGGRKFQLLSAGPDLTFGTDDDIVWPR